MTINSAIDMSKELKAMADKYIEEKHYKSLVYHLPIVVMWAEQCSNDEEIYIRRVGTELHKLSHRIQSVLAKALD